MIKGAAQDIRIDYDKLFTYQSGRSRFIGANDHRDSAGPGATSRSRANEAEIAENQSQIDLRGAVVITTSDGLKVETENGDLHRERRHHARARAGELRAGPHDGLERRRQLRPPARHAVDARPGAHHRRRPTTRAPAPPTSRPGRPATPSATATCASSAA